ncbi:NADPH:quinone oxidoreductase family protein [Aquamicrobium sp. LC103]|uniref:NADPH:quinone oxidoreductase family protein n=1 Tax=Aquamicrobium sp. LC103 TaxID=1120658 RepID=UPI00063EC2AD|nr:NADPH:quinone oxidoreductase family protein [Aquamicrobium sp. LC103]TKT75746.1 NADPH:quinone oxidoreductase family protein [Aquamicrobium sp. LC103]
MKAVICREFSPRANLRLEEVPTPTPGKGQVLVKVKACGLNFFDGLMVEGKYQTRPELPFTPGSEVAGVVMQVGEGVTALQPGQRVLAFNGIGGYAEEAIAEADRVYPIPDAMSFEQAAGFLITYATSHHALKDRAALQPGETVLVLGAAGGVGLTAVEIAKRMGARVIAAVSTQEKMDLCRAYGADETINYTDGDLRQQSKDLTGGRGVDVVYDPVGGAHSEAAVRSLAVNGRHLVIGFAAGDIPKLPLNLLLLKQTALIGVFWGAFARANPESHAANMAELFGWFAQGSLQPHISTSYTLDRFAEALDVVMERAAKGKVLLVMDDAAR